MEKEYSLEFRGKVHAYRFDSFEKKAIARCLQSEIKRLDKKILAIERNPKNEGQVKYQVAQEELLFEKKQIEQIIAEFSIG